MDRGAAGSKGGRTTFERYGRQHRAEIGAKGFASFTACYFAGDRQQAGDWLRTRAHERRLDSFVDHEMARRIEAGEKLVCEEIPILSEPDEVPF